MSSDTVGAGGPLARWGMLAAGAIALAALSLLWQAAATTDPWGWIVWGAEVAHFDLDTSNGGSPSWKPLPVLLTTPLSLFGDAAPELWLVASRAGGLLAVALAYRLASRVAGRTAGVLAAVLLLISAGWVRGHLHGYLEPSVVALLLGAVELHTGQRHRAALVLLFLAGLGRPEVWPCFGLYALWWASGARWGERILAASLVTATPVLWLGGDLWGSGDALHGSETARAVSHHDGRSGLETLMLAFSKLEVAMVLLAIAGLLLARRRDRTHALIAYCSVAWLAMLVALVALGYPASPRFVAPPMAGACVLAGIGVVTLWRAAPAVRLGRALRAGGLALVLGALVIPRMGATADVAELAGVRAQVQADLRAAVRQVGRGRILRCGTPVLRHNMEWNEGALAWELGLPLARVQVRTGFGGDGDGWHAGDRRAGRVDRADPRRITRANPPLEHGALLSRPPYAAPRMRRREPGAGRDRAVTSEWVLLSEGSSRFTRTPRGYFKRHGRTELE